MADNAGPVEIVVDIVDEFSDELQELEKKLDKLDAKSIDIDLNIDAEEEIKETQAQLKQLEKDIRSDLDITVEGEVKAQAVKTALSKDMRSTLHIDTDRGFGSIPPPIGEEPMEAVRGASRSSLNTILDREGAGGYIPEDVHPGRLDDFIDRDTPSMDFARRMQQHTKRATKSIGPDVLRMPTAVGDFFEGGMGAPQVGEGFMPTGVPGEMLIPDAPSVGPRGLLPDDPIQGFNIKVNRKFKRLAQTLNRLRPNIMMIWNALATMIPVFISLGAAAIGLAGAFATLGAAGIGILGLGLLGWGDSFGESLQNLQREAKMLGSRLFDVLEPAAALAQPVMRDWMEGAPRQVQRLVGPLQNLITAFDEPLSMAGGGIIGWIQEVIGAMVSMRDIITQIAFRFASIAGAFIIDFMQNMVMFAYENQEALINMASALRQVLSFLLQFSIFVVRVLQPLAALTPLLGLLSAILSNRLVAGLTAAAITTIAMSAALTSLFAATSAASTGLIAMAFGPIVSFIGMVQAAIAETWAWIASLGVLRGALVTTGIGALAVGAGLLASGAMQDTPSGPASGRTRGGGTTINIQGDVGRDEMNRLLDEVPDASQREQRLNNEMDR